MKHLNKTAIDCRMAIGLFLVCLFSACGGGSSGGNDVIAVNDRVTFQGSFQKQSAARVIGEKQDVTFPVVTIAALGQSSLTDASGSWSFGVRQSDYTSAGGEVLFGIVGEGIDASLVVGGLATDSTLITIVFEQGADGSTRIVDFQQDGAAGLPDAMGPEMDDGQLSASEQACALLNGTQISIVDPVTEVTSDGNTCPLAIDSIITVVNNGDLAFEYEVTVDFADITVAPLGGAASPGESVVHNGAYRCGTEQSFDTSINVRVTRIFSADGEAFSDSELISLCDDDFSFDGQVDSSPISVVITN
jgi:hypothetical protein